MRHDGIHKWQFLFTPFSGNIGCQSSSFLKKNGTFLSKEIVLFTDLFLKTILLRILLLKQTWIPLLIQI